MRKSSPSGCPANGRPGLRKETWQTSPRDDLALKIHALRNAAHMLLVAEEIDLVERVMARVAEYERRAAQAQKDEEAT